ncbi:MAG: hypothetical protein WD226_09515 [Planctomycetota bacterium]
MLLLRAATLLALFASLGYADRCLAHENVFTPLDVAAGDALGWSLALDGAVAVVGTPFHAGTGAAYVYRQGASGAWQQEAKLVAADGGPNDFFGQSVGVSGDSIVVGAYQADEGASNAGAAYVFEFTAGSWNQAQKLTASIPDVSGFFGSAVAIEGDTLAVGAHRVDGTTPDEGAVYVFERTGSIWNETQKLSASDATQFQLFGRAVALSGDVLVAGAHLDASAGNASGAAYVFARSGGTWSETQKLVASDASAGDRFGFAVDVDGARLVVGAYEDDSSGSEVGSVYVFDLVGGVWTEVEELSPSDGLALDAFGRSLALSGDTLVVGAAQHDAAASEGGAGYVFRFDGVSFVQEDKLGEGVGANARLGFAVATSASEVLLSAIGGAAETGGLHTWRVGITFDPLGTGTAGSGGLTPALGTGDCFALAIPGTLRIENALGGTIGAIVIGNTLTFLPVFGGVLYTQPINTIPITFSGPAGLPGAGVFELAITLVPTPPAGVTFVMQAGVFDASAVSSIALTNAGRMQFL